MAEMMPVAQEVARIGPHPSATPMTMEYMDHLRVLRCDILALDRLAEAIRSGEARIEDNAQYISSVRDHAGATLAEIEALVCAADVRGEHMRELRLSWDRLVTVPVIASPDSPVDDAQRRLAELKTTSDICREIIYELGYQTIPGRLNEWLEQAPAGYYVPFHDVFEDEVPNEADRLRILRFLAFQPMTVKDGLVDAANGLVYRYSPDRREQLWSLVKIGGLFLLLTMLVTGWGQLGRWTDKWPFEPEDWFDLLVVWFAVMAGVVVHLVVGTAKRVREQRALPPVFATNQLMKRINAREGLIMVKLATALLGFFALLATETLGDIQPLTAFLAGYALDSVVGLFSTSLDNQAAAQANVLKQKLKVT